MVITMTSATTNCVKGEYGRRARGGWKGGKGVEGKAGHSTGCPRIPIWEFYREPHIIMKAKKDRG